MHHAHNYPLQQAAPVWHLLFDPRLGRTADMRSLQESPRQFRVGWFFLNSDEIIHLSTISISTIIIIAEPLFFCFLDCTKSVLFFIPTTEVVLQIDLFINKSLLCAQVSRKPWYHTSIRKNVKDIMMIFLLMIVFERLFSSIFSPCVQKTAFSQMVRWRR